jgi:phosphoadenosine phosphosulfate reductase
MTPRELTSWALSQGRAIVSTNFRPYEAVILHLATQAQPDIPVLWVDHGFNRPATYRFADLLTKRLNLNLQSYLPRLSAAHWEARHGESSREEFSTTMKLEPFARGMRELAPQVWLTALRKVQNPHRATLDAVSRDDKFAGVLKVSPVFEWTDADM